MCCCFLDASAVRYACLRQQGCITQHLYTQQQLSTATVTIGQCCTFCKVFFHFSLNQCSLYWNITCSNTNSTEATLVFPSTPSHFHQQHHTHSATLRTSHWIAHRSIIPLVNNKMEPQTERNDNTLISLPENVVDKVSFLCTVSSNPFIPSQHPPKQIAMHLPSAKDVYNFSKVSSDFAFVTQPPTAHNWLLKHYHWDQEDMTLYPKDPEVLSSTQSLLEWRLMAQRNLMTDDPYDCWSSEDYGGLEGAGVESSVRHVIINRQHRVVASLDDRGLVGVWYVSICLGVCVDAVCACYSHGVYMLCLYTCFVVHHAPLMYHQQEFTGSASAKAGGLLCT